jgi:hypothetical protein
MAKCQCERNALKPNKRRLIPQPTAKAKNKSLEELFSCNCDCGCGRDYFYLLT